MKIIHSDNEYAFLELDTGEKLPEMIIVKVNDYTVTYRIRKEKKKC